MDQMNECPDDTPLFNASDSIPEHIFQSYLNTRFDGSWIFAEAADWQFSHFSESIHRVVVI